MMRKALGSLRIAASPRLQVGSVRTIHIRHAIIPWIDQTWAAAAAAAATAVVPRVGYLPNIVALALTNAGMAHPILKHETLTPRNYLEQAIGHRLS